MTKARILEASLAEVNANKQNEKKYIELRGAAHHLYYECGLTKAMIGTMLKVSKQFVCTWTKHADQDVRLDRRGWRKGTRHRWTRQTERRIKSIHRLVTTSPREFYCGATAIQQVWRQRYPDAPPPLRTIGQMLAELGLSKPRRTTRPGKGAAAYLCYPEHTIYTLFGGRVLEMDFIGQRYLAGVGTPIHFIAFAFKKEPKLRHFRLIEGQTANVFIRECRTFFSSFEKPDFIKVDNCAATIGSTSGKRTLSRVVLFLLEQQIVPIFAVPRQPFSQASVEGNNSVFARKFWNRKEYRSLKEVDKYLDWFNQASLGYTAYQRPLAQAAETATFIPRLYFLRQVTENPDSDRGCIDVLHERIEFDTAYINYFVLAEWNLKNEQLTIFFEREKQQQILVQIPFHINPLSRKHYFPTV